MLKDMDNGVDGEQPVRIFVMGDNVWRYEDEVAPVPGAAHPLLPPQRREVLTL